MIDILCFILTNDSKYMVVEKAPVVGKIYSLPYAEVEGLDNVADCIESIVQSVLTKPAKYECKPFAFFKSFDKCNVHSITYAYKVILNDLRYNVSVKDYPLRLMRMSELLQDDVTFALPRDDLVWSNFKESFKLV